MGKQDIPKFLGYLSSIQHLILKPFVMSIEVLKLNFKYILPGVGFMKSPFERTSFIKGRYFFPLGRPLKISVLQSLL